MDDQGAEMENSANPFRTEQDEFEPMEVESDVAEASKQTGAASAPAVAPSAAPFVFGARPLVMPAAPLRATPDATTSYLAGYGAQSSSGTEFSSSQAARVPNNKVEAFVHNAAVAYKSYLDAFIPHVAWRWTFTGVVFAIYLLRAFVFIDGWYIVTYALGIYLLNLVVRFLSPLVDPDEDAGSLLPTKTDDEFRPFLRQLPEFKFWHSGTRAVLLAFGATFFELFNVPVFWPILLAYFVILFYMTMQRQISHMRKHNYVPWNFGKRTYAK
eukprot:a847751_158.p2 GENE.a847751_158~~a847751_158.p2  ORF type:complete len:280 (-),score=71.51 a847751_158:32-841(-)